MENETDLNIMLLDTCKIIEQLMKTMIDTSNTYEGKNNEIVKVRNRKEMLFPW